MDLQTYDRLLSGGAYSLPYLIRLWNEDYDFRFVNDNRPVSWGGNTYAASAFNFTPSDSGDSTLEIEVCDNQLISMLDAGTSFDAEFVGIILEGGTVQELRGWKKRYGKAKWTGKSATVTFPPDDRLSMTFPALVFNGDNNRGNS